MIKTLTASKNALILFIATILVCTLFIQAFATPKAKAVSASEWRPGRIIDDAVYLNKDSMSPQQIQAFLNSKVPVCDTWQKWSGWYKGYWNSAPYTCLKDYSENGKSSAQIIWEAAQNYRINPQLLLVTLQKETSMITDTWAATWQYKRAVGYKCPDSKLGTDVDANQNGCYDSHENFIAQINGAAFRLRDYMDNPTGYNHRGGTTRYIAWTDKAECGGSNVYIENQATAALYNYTPYQPNQAALNNMYGLGDACSSYGNRNFWIMFNDWFGDTDVSNLVRTPSDQTYYLLTNSKRFAIPNGDLLYAYGLDKQRVSVISDQVLQTIPNGGMLQTTFTTSGDGTVYLADLATKFGVASGEYCVKWGINCDTPSQIGAEISDTLKNGGVLQPIMNNMGNYYLMDNGNKKQFLSARAMLDSGYSMSSNTKIANWTNSIRNFGFSYPENGSFVKFGTSDTIFAYANGGFYSILDYNQFRNWYSPNTPSHYDTNSKYNVIPPTIIGELSNIVSDGYGNKYMLDNSSKIDLTNVSQDWPAGLHNENLSIFLNRLPIRSTATTETTYRQADGAIFKVSSQQKQHLNSVYDYFALGFDKLQSIQITYNLNMPQGNTIFAEGSAYKIQGSDAIFRIGLNGKSYPFQNVKQIWDFRTNPVIPKISNKDASQFTIGSPLMSIIKDARGQLYIVNDLGKIYLSAADIVNWGINGQLALEVSNSLADRIPNSNITAPTFFSSQNGTIFKGENGLKRPISTFDKYKELGGNVKNTSLIPEDVMNTIPTGPIIN